MAAFTFLLQSPPLFLNPQPKQSFNCVFRAYPSPKRFAVRASASKAPRIRKKAKSDEQLCSEIREFLASVGLPEDHVPSTKELLHHGRNELAYIVRRRGHKLLRELLPHSRKTYVNDYVNDFNAEKSLGTTQEVTVGYEDSLTGQDEKVNKNVEVISFSTEVSLGDNSPNIGLCLNSSDSIGENDKVKNRVGGDVGGDSSSMETSVIDNYSSRLTKKSNHNSIGRDGMSVELPTSSLEEDSSNNLNGHEAVGNNVVGDKNDNLQIMDEKAGSIGQDESLSSEVPAVDFLPSSKIESTSISNGLPKESSANLSLKEKVAKFILNGELDLIQDESGLQESKGLMKWDEAIGVKTMTVPEENAEDLLADDKSVVTLNKGISTSGPVHPPMTANHYLRDDLNPSERLVGADSGKNMDETISNEDQAEMNHLKLMLHQKELELTLLKEQIEKEKHALSVLQTKVDTEMNKSQEIIYKKDVELHAVEENMSGLEEVEIQYSGDCEIVEVAGSFNGWHHKIKLDPLPTSDSNDPAEPRKPKLWSTVLWLYPGTYEIKFIVDGQWRIDPQRDSVTKGTICNNILKVEE